MIDGLVDVAIVGGGLAGLALADHLHRSGRSFHLYEARSRLGGRIHVHRHADDVFDIGPSWFWPGQPRLASMVDRFGLSVFEQYSHGDLTYQTETGEVQRGRGYASMQGSYRLKGGMGALTASLANGLPDDRLSIGVQVSHLTRDDAGTHLFAEQERLLGTAHHVVLACPPRIAAGLSFSPTLPNAALQVMGNVPTWMAGQAKFLALYEKPFWREAGLSGDAMSRHGPMVEIHDACDPSSGLGALFGFIGVPASVRMDRRDELNEACLTQLARLFGEAALQPLSSLVQDWANEPETATAADWGSQNAHPAYGLPEALSELWDGHLLMGSTEVAEQFGGYLEGALEAAEQVFETLTAKAAG